MCSNSTGNPTTAIDPYPYPLSKVIVLNIEGLLPHRYKRKVKLLSETAQKEKALKLALTESHLNDEIRDAEIRIENFTIFRNDRGNHRKKGGVITYIHDQLATGTQVLLSDSNTYTEFQVLYMHTIDTVIVNIYRPPACPSNKFLERLSKIKDTLHNLPKPTPNILLVGDLNFPLIDWTTESVYGGANDMRLQAYASLRFAQDLYLTQLIHAPTRGNNTLDVAMCNNEELIYEYSVDKTNLSDHNIITLTTSIKTDTHPSTTVKQNQTFNQLNFFSESIKWNDVKSDIAAVDWDQVMEDSDPESQYENLLRICFEISKKHIPYKRKPTRPNIPKDRKILMRKRTKIRKKLRLTTNILAKRNLEKKIVDIENKLKTSIDQEYEKQESMAVSRIKTNPKYFYKFAENKSKIRTGVGPLRNAQGHVTRTPAESAQLLQHHYEGIFSAPSTEKVIKSPQTFFTSDSHRAQSLEDVVFSPNTIKEVITHITSNAASGPDDFPAILLKNCAEELSMPLYTLYHTSLDSGIIPSQLKLARVTPIYKGGSRAEPNNYRPIALTSHIIKVFERILVNWMTSYLEDNKKLSDNQYGFRSGRSCLAQLLAHHEKILTSLEHDTNVDVIYLDFAKAYDKVDHGILLHKVREIGITGKVGQWLHSFLTNRQQVVMVDGIVTQPSKVISGVPQGSVLGPLLFLIHITDINEYIQHSSIASFADDTRILKEVTSDHEAALLQSDLNALYAWAKVNNMAFNNNKFEHMFYSSKQHTAEIHQYKAQDGTNIVPREHVRDLGVTLSSDGNFSIHITNVTKKARSQAAWILRTFKTRDSLPMLTLYKSLVLPILEYCCQLWSPWKVSDKQMLEGVQRTYTSRINEIKHLDYWERLTALDLYSLERRRERYTIIYVFKILNGMVVNNIGLQTTVHQRLGRQCHIQRIHPRSSVRVKTLKENAFAIRGPRLFNALPKSLRDPDISRLEQFKSKLDNFLRTLPDQPNLPHYHLRAAGNSITDHLAQRRADGEF